MPKVKCFHPPLLCMCSLIGPRLQYYWEGVTRLCTIVFYFSCYCSTVALQQQLTHFLDFNSWICEASFLSYGYSDCCCSHCRTSLIRIPLIRNLANLDKMANWKEEGLSVEWTTAHALSNLLYWISNNLVTCSIPHPKQWPLQRKWKHRRPRWRCQSYII